MQNQIFTGFWSIIWHKADKKIFSDKETAYVSSMNYVFVTILSTFSVLCIHFILLFLMGPHRLKTASNVLKGSTWPNGTKVLRGRTTCNWHTFSFAANRRDGPIVNPDAGRTYEEKNGVSNLAVRSRPKRRTSTHAKGQKPPPPSAVSKVGRRYRAHKFIKTPAKDPMLKSGLSFTIRRFLAKISTF